MGKRGLIGGPLQRGYVCNILRQGEADGVCVAGNLCKLDIFYFWRGEEEGCLSDRTRLFLAEWGGKVWVSVQCILVLGGVCGMDWVRGWDGVV